MRKPLPQPLYLVLHLARLETLDRLLLCLYYLFHDYRNHRGHRGPGCLDLGLTFQRKVSGESPSYKDTEG